MRLASVVWVAAVALASLSTTVACKTPPTTPPTDDPVAVQTSTFEPTAFSVEVRGQGRPVILIPGLGCPSSVWDGAVAHLRGYQTHALTLAGFAGKARIDAPLAQTTVDELARYISDRGLRQPIIIGHSLGGSIAYLLAARAPAEIGPVVVVDAGAPMGSQANDGEAAQLRAMWHRASDEQFTRQVRDAFRQMSAVPARMDPVIAEVTKSDRRAIGDAVYELSTSNVRGELDQIRAPVLLVLADGSLQDDFRRQSEAVRDREVVVVPGAKHFVMLDEPERFFNAVDGFLSKHETVASN